MAIVIIGQKLQVLLCFRHYIERDTSVSDLLQLSDLIILEAGKSSSLTIYSSINIIPFSFLLFVLWSTNMTDNANPTYVEKCVLAIVQLLQKCRYGIENLCFR